MRARQKVQLWLAEIALPVAAYARRKLMALEGRLLRMKYFAPKAPPR